MDNQREIIEEFLIESNEGLSQRDQDFVALERSPDDELALARNQILQFTTTQEDVGFIATLQRLNLITTELQA
jgi:hypothetical protein